MTRTHLASTLFFALAVLLGTPAHAATKTLCFRYPVTTVDSGIGEDFAAFASTQYPAFSVSVTAQQTGAGTTANYGFVTDSAGCATINVTNNGTSWAFMLIGRADIAGNVLTTVNTSGTQAFWIINWTAPASWTTKTHTVAAGRIANLMGIGSFVLSRNPVVLTGGETITLHDQDCPNRPGRSCQSGNDFFVSAEHSSRKYVIAHEIGHIVMELAGGMPASGTNMSNARGEFTVPNTVVGGANCEWAVDDHMMTSWEWSSTAYIEGWAQFYATATWNLQTAGTGQGAYQYHKTSMTFGSVTVTPPGFIDMEVGTDSLGACDCGGGASSCSGRNIVKKGSGTELDWSRQFWDFYTNSGTRPDFTIMQMGIALAGPSITAKERAWDGMKSAWQAFDAAWASAMFSRWDGLDHTNGINYCSTGSSCN